MGQLKGRTDIEISALIPYRNNAKRHSEAQVRQIADSITEFGFLNPVLIDKDYNIIAGHGRVAAAGLLGMESVPCVFVEGLTEAQRRAYILADNRLTELGEWDMRLVAQELSEIEAFGLNAELTGFTADNVKDADWFRDRERNDTSREDGNNEYNEFLDKFEQPKTTDDCYTPDNIYDAVCGWVENEYKVSKATFTRPFYPGGDFESHKYPDGCVVVDNPPFSILAKIVDFYIEKGVKFFLFAPALTVLNYVTRQGVCAICAYIGITYENGATVPTSFLTNLDDPDVAARATPDLFALLDDANDENLKAMKKSFPKYEFPNEVLTAAKIGWLAKYGQSIEIKRSESQMIRELDAMKESGKGIFGNALLLSERAAAERAAAERAAAERAAAERAAATKWKLSERELEIVRSLGA